MMKNSLILLISIFSLIACSDDKKANSVGEGPVVNQAEPIVLEKKEPEPKTITLKEVSRIALVEAKQFLTQAKHNNIDFSSVLGLYDKAQASYDNGDYKQAQKLAVDVRLQIEQLLQTK